MVEARGNEQVKRSDVWVFAAFFAGAVGCLGTSAWFHCVLCHSEKRAVWAQRGDYMGIVGLIWGSFVPSLWYGFGCEGEEGLRWGYLGMVSSAVLFGSGFGARVLEGRGTGRRTRSGKGKGTRETRSGPSSEG